MNGCKEVQLNFDSRSIYDENCNIIENVNNNLSTTYYMNLSKLDFNVLNNQIGYLRICKYDMNKNFVSSLSYETTDFNIGTKNSINLDSHYLYRISYRRQRFSNFVGYQCNVGIGSMSNELAFGSVKYNDTIGVIIPFVIVIIGFALGYSLIKRIINKGSKGSAL